GYFAQPPADEAPALARQGKAGLAEAPAAGDADSADLGGPFDKGASSSTRRAGDEAKQKKEAEAYRKDQPRSPARSKADGAGYDELASQLETGSSTGAGSRNAPGSGGGASAGPPAQAAPVQPAPAPASPTSPTSKTAKAPAKKPSPEPAPEAAPPPPAENRAAESEDDAQAGAPADRKRVASREASKERAQQDTAARVSALHKQALAAASRGDCAAARTAINTILRLDATYHRDHVARDTRLQDCLAVKK
ncbi:MAG TPA: hypothetical protein VNM90_07045, partial [Haliangium sp.]|nr:hypothetical protein [Haliangium sp.]